MELLQKLVNGWDSSSIRQSEPVHVPCVYTDARHLSMSFPCLSAIVNGFTSLEVEISETLSAIICLIYSWSAGLTENGIGHVWPTVGSEHCTSNSNSNILHRSGLDVK
jgi:hypothetical protein